MNFINAALFILGLAVMSGALAALIWGSLQLFKSYTSASGLFSSPADFWAVASVAGGLLLLMNTIIPLVIGLIALITGLIAALVLVLTSANDSTDPTSQYFLYQQQSKVELTLDHEAQESFYRVIGYDETSDQVRLALANCVQSNPELTAYDFADCSDGSYYPLPLDNTNNQQIAQAKSAAREADSLLSQLTSQFDQLLTGSSTEISVVQSKISSHSAQLNHHDNQVRRHHANLRHCAWWDAPCRGRNAWLGGQIRYHQYWANYHNRQRLDKQHQLAALQQEQMQVIEGRQQLVETQSQLSAKGQQLETAQQTSPILHHDDGSISIAVSDLGIGVHWVQNYTTQITPLSDSDYQITVDCPLMQKICETLQLNHDQYPLLWQQDIGPVRLLSDGITSHFNTDSQQWKIMISNQADLSVSANDAANNAFSLALYYDYRNAKANGPGSSADTPQIVQQGEFNDFTYAGALKGRWHRGDMEADGQEIVRWQRIERVEQGGQSGLVFTENPQLIVPTDYAGISYYTPNKPRRLVELMLVDIDEDGLDDLLSVYSASSGTTLTYRSLIDVANQTPSAEVLLAELDAANIDRVQLIQGTHHVYGKQDGVNYLLLHSKTDQKVYPIALVQPKDADLSDPDQAVAGLNVLSAQAIPHALAVDGIWLNDPAYGFAAGDQLLVSWIKSEDDSNYIDRNQISVEQQTYSLTTLRDTSPTGHSFTSASDIAGTDATLNVQWNTYGLHTELSGCELSTTYSYRGHLSLQLINDPQTPDNQLGAVVSASNACELVRAMDPYHRGKSDRLLVQNHQQTLNAWSHLDLAHLPQDRFAFYLDYSNGAYQPQGILTQANLEAAAYQYPLSVTLQSQHLGTNESDEQNSFIATLNHYCDKQQLEDQRCIAEWFKAATHINDHDSIFDACSIYGEVDSAFVGCLKQRTMARLDSFVGKDISSIETRFYAFTHSYDVDRHIIQRRDLSSGQIATIDIEGLFNTMEYIVSSYEAGAEQASNYDHQRPLLSELAHGAINGLIPKSYAGAEIGACHDKGQRSTQVCALMDYAKILAVAIIAADKISIKHPTDSQSAEANNPVNAESVLALNSPVTSGHVKHEYFCLREQSITQCDSRAQGAKKITITQTEESLSALVTLDGLGPHYFLINQNQPGYSAIQDWYQGGSTSADVALMLILANLYAQSSAVGEVSESLKELIAIVIKRQLSDLVSHNTFPIDDQMSIALMALMTGIGFDQLSSDNPSTKKYSQQVAIYIWVMEWLAMQNHEHDQAVADIVESFNSLNSLSCEALCQQTEEELQQVSDQISSLQQNSDQWLDGKMLGLPTFLQLLQDEVNRQQTQNQQAFNQSLKQHELATGHTVANELAMLQTILSEDVIKFWQLLYPLGGVDENGEPHLKSFQNISLEYSHDVKTLGLHFNDVNNAAIYEIQITEDMVEVWINGFRLSDAWAMNGRGELNHAIDRLWLTTDVKVITYVGRLVPQITALIQEQDETNASPDQVKTDLLALEAALVSPIKHGRYLPEGGDPQQENIELVENQQNEIDDEECVICHRPVDRNNCTVCPNRHHSHNQCADDYMRDNGLNCPICRAAVNPRRHYAIELLANGPLRVLRAINPEYVFQALGVMIVLEAYEAYEASHLSRSVKLIFKLHVPDSPQHQPYLKLISSNVSRQQVNFFCDKGGKKPLTRCMNGKGSPDVNGGYPIYAHIRLYGENIINHKNQVILDFELFNVIQFDDTDLSNSPKAVITEHYRDMAESSPQITQVKLNQLIPRHKRDESIQSLSFDHDLNINMEGMFRETRFNGFIGDWDVSRVWTMERMFYRNSAFNQPIGSWNVSNVTHMWRMFNGASSFNQDISGWDVSNAEDMRFMFSEASSFSQDISGWEVNKVQSHAYFDNLSGLTQEQIPPKFRGED